MATLVALFEMVNLVPIDDVRLVGNNAIKYRLGKLLTQFLQVMSTTFCGNGAIMNVTQVLDELTASNSQLTLLQIQQAIGKYCQAELAQLDTTTPTLDFANESEWLAFQFRPFRKPEGNVWNTYYGPVFIKEFEDGRIETDPDRSTLTVERFAYWETRADEVENAFLKFRYSSLCWDLSRLGGVKRNIKMAETLCKAAVDIAKKDISKYLNDQVEFVSYAIQVAISTKRDQCLARLRSVLIEIESRSDDDAMLGTWGFSFDTLWKTETGVTAAEWNQIIEDLEQRFDRAIATHSKDSHLIMERCLKRLSRHYQRIDDRKSLAEQLEKYCKNMIQLTESFGGLNATHWLHRTHRFCNDLGYPELAESLDPAITKAGERSTKELFRATFSIPISEDELAEWSRKLISESLVESCDRICNAFIPRMLGDEPQDSSFISFLASTKIDGRGRPVASVGSPAVDPDGARVLRQTKEIQLASLLLRKAIEMLVDLHPAPTVIEQITSSKAFEKSKEICELALNYFFEDKSVEFVYLASPLIEATIRGIVESQGGATMKRGRHQSLQLRNIDELLQEDIWQQLLGEAAEQCNVYFRLLLVDQRGWNLRNDLAHGIPPTCGYWQAADRLFHVMLILGRLPDLDVAFAQD